MNLPPYDSYDNDKIGRPYEKYDYILFRKPINEIYLNKLNNCSTFFIVYKDDSYIDSVYIKPNKDLSPTIFANLIVNLFPDESELKENEWLKLSWD